MIASLRLLTIILPKRQESHSVKREEVKTIRLPSIGFSLEAAILFTSVSISPPMRLS